MAKISVTGSAFAGFGVIARHPGAVLTWGVVMLVLSLGPVLALILLMGPEILKAVAAMMPPRDGPIDQDAVRRMMSLQSGVMLVQIGGWLWSTFIKALICSAVFRAVLEPGQSRGAFLRLGAQELWLTLLFLALFAAAASAFLGYIYVATAGEVNRRADAEISREMESLEAAYRQGGVNALNQTIVERATGERPFLYFLADKTGKRISGSIEASPLEDFEGDGPSWSSFKVTEVDLDGAEVRNAARGVQERLTGGEVLFVGADVAASEGYVRKIVRALWGAGALVIILGLAGGVLISRNVSRSMQGLVDLVAAVQAGDLQARAKVRGARDEYDELAEGLNDMLDRIERLMGGLRHAGDAIAHDLRSPLTRLRARMEVALIDAENGKGDPVAALETALQDADGVLKTFNAVLAIARLQAAG